MKKPFLRGEKVYLRPLEREDLEGRYGEWLNDPDVTRFLEVGSFPQSRDSMESYFQNVALSSNNILFAICEVETDRHVGNFRLGPIRWVHRVAGYGILIGEKEVWGKGYATEVTRLILEYAFTKLNLNKIDLAVDAENEAAIRVYVRAGFQVEGRRQEEFYRDGAYRDSVLMGITRGAWEGHGDQRAVNRT